MESVALAHVAHGSGPPVLLLHGLLGSGRNWAAIARRLAGSFRAVTVDLRNHGDSPWHEVVTYAAMAADVEALLDGLGLERASVIGHSMGGKVAMTLAATAPERVAHLVVVDIAPVAYDRGFGRYIEAMRAADLDRPRAEIEAQLREVAPEDGVRAFLLHNLDRRGERARWRPNLAALAAGMDSIVGFPDLAGAYDGPTLVISGANSGYVQPEHHRLVRRLFPRARFVAVRDAGHWVHAEQPERLVATVTPFLERA
jgi:esterase